MHAGLFCPVARVSLVVVVAGGETVEEKREKRLNLKFLGIMLLLAVSVFLFLVVREAVARFSDALLAALLVLGVALGAMMTGGMIASGVIVNRARDRERLDQSERANRRNDTPPVRPIVTQPVMLWPQQQPQRESTWTRWPESQASQRVRTVGQEYE